MTALQVMLELLPPSHWDSTVVDLSWPCELHGCCWKGRKSLALFNPCSHFRFSSAASSDEECLQNLSAVLSSGCCTQRLEFCVKSLALVLQAAQLLSQTFEFQLLLWFQWWDLCFWSSSDQFQQCSLGPSGLVKNSHCVLHFTSLEG